MPAKTSAVECNDIETAWWWFYEVAAYKVGQPELRCSNEAFLFMWPNCFGRRAIVGVGSTAHLDKYKYILIARHDINLAGPTLDVASEYAQAAFCQIMTGQVLSRVSCLLGCGNGNEGPRQRCCGCRDFPAAPTNGFFLCRAD